MAAARTLFGFRSITSKLATMAAAATVFMVLVAVTVLLIARGELMAERTEKAHAIVDAAWSIADSLRHAAASGTMSMEEARARFLATGGVIWFEGHTNYVFIYDTESGLDIANIGNTAQVGKDVRGFRDAHGLAFGSMMLDLVKQRGEGTISYAFPKGTNPAPMEKIAYVRGFAPFHVVIVAAEYMTDIDDVFWGMVRTAGVLIGSLLLVSIVIAWLVARSIVRPLAALRVRMAGLSEGDLDTAVPGANRQDELGEMARAVLLFKDHMVRDSRLAVEHEAERQQTEANQRRAALTGRADRVETETGTALRSISSRTTAMAATADAMSQSATRTGASVQEAATAAAQALANAQTVASAAEELAASIREIGGQVSQSTTMVGRAVAAGTEARTTIEALNQEVGRIGAVADMIGEIAAKTNLLALNATIEAARAGDAGKGFAVVASEVKALATQTARSTEEIGQHIAKVRSATGASVAAVTRIEKTVTEINAIAGSIAAAVEEQGAATSEIARNMTETADAANEMTNRINEITAEAVDTGRHASDVRDNTAALNQAVEELRHSVIRVVRTSTTEVDRRQSPRRAVDVGGRLIVSGQGEYAGQITDLSEGGARMRCGARPAVGTRVMLRLDGVAVGLACAVRAMDGEELHLAFALDAAGLAALRPALDRLNSRLAA
jgi:methyl-accepting chemotaxis protein